MHDSMCWLSEIMGGPASGPYGFFASSISRRADDKADVCLFYFFAHGVTCVLARKMRILLKSVLPAEFLILTQAYVWLGMFVRLWIYNSLPACVCGFPGEVPIYCFSFFHCIFLGTSLDTPRSLFHWPGVGAEGAFLNESKAFSQRPDPWSLILDPF